MGKVKVVHFLGSRIDWGEVSSIGKNYKANVGDLSCMVIGNGSHRLTDMDYALLQGNLEPGATIHIDKHGVVDKDGRHSMDGRLTSEILAAIQAQAPDTCLNLTVWACYA